MSLQGLRSLRQLHLQRRGAPEETHRSSSAPQDQIPSIIIITDIIVVVTTTFIAVLIVIIIVTTIIVTIITMAASKLLELPSLLPLLRGRDSELMSYGMMHLAGSSLGLRV